MWTRLKRWLYLTHRWLGIVACIFFAMWFVSGVVMMYVGYPRLTESERLFHLPPLADDGALLPPHRALALAGIAGPLQDLRLAAARGGQPVYLAVPAIRPPSGGGRRVPARGSNVEVVDARSGERLHSVDAALALASAAAYAGDAHGLRYAGTVDEDAFTHSRALDPHRPLHVVELADAPRTRLYISGRTGEVVRDAPRAERLWNLAGAWIHWLYPLRGTALDAYWADIVNGLSILGIAMALAGTVVGVMRWRFRRPYRSGARSPYPGRMMRWHHVSGLLFAVATIAWIFSGLMSMNPWRLFDTGAPPLRTAALQGGPLQLAEADAAPAALLAAARAQGRAVHELRWIRTLGQTAVLAHAASGRPLLLDSQAAKRRSIDPDALEAAAARLVDAPLRRIERLSAYDLHYYDRAPHTMTGGGDKPLPVWRLIFDDAHATWVHLDPQTGAVLGRSDRGRRASRWLFAMLHSWDWLPLLERRPLWDVLLIALSLGGTVLSVTGIVVGWRRLGTTLRAARRRPAARAQPASRDAAAMPVAPRAK